MNEYPLADWKTSELLKEAALHLLNQPEYVPMNPLARCDMTRFCHAVRRKLMVIQEQPLESRRGLLESFCTDTGLNITTDDYLRYRVHVHGYAFTIIMGIPLGDSNEVHPAVQILHSEGRDG